VDVVIELLDVLAVVALAAGQSEEPLLEDRVGAVPHRDREAQALVAIADPGDAVLVPAVGARSGVVVREVVPGRAPRAVVLAHAAPGALGELRAPALPVLAAVARLGETNLLGVHGCRYARAARLLPPAAARTLGTERSSARMRASAPTRARHGPATPAS